VARGALGLDGKMVDFGKQRKFPCATLCWSFWNSWMMCWMI
jgi:hypothetical protein